ncbi:18464_t:CDS:1 [Funneliformis geosporum]|uniref:18464_t:CDS:1 n=1 Tax=Funneliformis geosporum TaxID=1117311 RepID=A0A9W4T2T9_9GLOM|nr:18464_t:CDS:1 [Funneliformis geosporum]
MLQSSSNRQDIIRAALDTLKNYPLDSKLESINSIAKSFGLSEATLRRTVKNGGLLNRSGPPTILAKYEEDQLADYCINMQKLGFGLTKSGVKYCVMEIMQLNKHQHLFGENEPDQDWWKCFMRGHPELSIRTSQELSEAHAQ